MGMTMVAGCLAATDDSTLEGEEDIDVGSAEQALSNDRQSEVVFDQWGDLAAIKPQFPQLYLQGLEVLVASGVDCTAYQKATGSCVSVDEEDAVLAMQQGTVSCKTTCEEDVYAMTTCRRVCCIELIWQVCGSEVTWFGMGTWL
jgi:hypothetical protein